MRTRFIVSLLMVIALALSIVSTVSADKGVTGTGNTFDPSKMTQADKDALAAKIKIADSFMKALAARAIPDSIVNYKLNVGKSGDYQEPNNNAYNDYCGPAASRVALSARTSSVPDILTVASKEGTLPYPPAYPTTCGSNCGTNALPMKNYINSKLNTSYYVTGVASGQSQFTSWVTWDIESGWSMITLVRTTGMPGWGSYKADHYVAINEITVNGATLQTVWYVDTASVDAGHSGSYFNSADPTTFFKWVSGEAHPGQIW